MLRSASYDDLLISMLKDEKRAFAYLNAALDEGDPRVFLVALRNVAKAQGGVAKVASRAGLNRESLYRALSEEGNPSVQTMTSVLGALGARLGIAKIEHRPPETGAHRPLFSFTVTYRRRPLLVWPNSPHVSGVQLAAA